MTTANLPAKKFFLNRKFYMHVKKTSESNVEKTTELIKLFGGQIEQFLEQEVTYVLTDIPKNEWPPQGQGLLKDNVLETAIKLNVKLMSLQDLLVWCSKYLTSQSSSDDDDDIKANIRKLQPPYIKFENFACNTAPTVKEFNRWPELNLNASLPIGRSFFSDSDILLSTPNQSANNILHFNNSAQLTQQANSIKTNTNISISANTTSQQQLLPANIYPNNLNGLVALPKTTNNQQTTNIPQRGVRRRHSIFCEICNQKLNEKIEEHILTQTHKINTSKTNWTDVDSVIDSLPSLSTLNMRRLTDITPPNGIEHQEFLCLHKVDSVDQLFNEVKRKRMMVQMV